MECGDWPLSNVWLGVSVENQKRADERIPILLQTPAAVHFVSIEPMLGPVNIRDALYGYPEPYGGGHLGFVTHDMALDAGEPSMEGLDLGWQEPEWHQTTPPLSWVIVGGESGPGARPCHPDWVRSLRDQCQEAGVPFFLKQIGAWRWQEHGSRYKPDNPPDAIMDAAGRYNRECANMSGVYELDGLDLDSLIDIWRVGKKTAGRLLDGREWNEYPESS